MGLWGLKWSVSGATEGLQQGRTLAMDGGGICVLIGRTDVSGSELAQHGEGRGLKVTLEEPQDCDCHSLSEPQFTDCKVKVRLLSLALPRLCSL